MLPNEVNRASNKDMEAHPNDTKKRNPSGRYWLT
jgi:hypothetical protein